MKGSSGGIKRLWKKGFVEQMGFKPVVKD